MWEKIRFCQWQFNGQKSKSLSSFVTRLKLKRLPAEMWFENQLFNKFLAIHFQVSCRERGQFLTKVKFDKSKFLKTLTGRSLSALGFLQIYRNKRAQQRKFYAYMYYYFLGTIVRRKYLPKISAVGLFSCDKFEENPKQKVIDL